MTDYKYILSCIAISIAVYCLYIQKITIEDYNWESMDIPLTVGYLEKGFPQSVINNYVEQDSHGAFSYPNRAFKFNHYASQAPLLNLCYTPFIKLFGVNNRAIALHSLFFTSLLLIGTFLLALRMYDKWVALLAIALMVSSLSLLIHSKNGVPHSIVATCLMIALAYFLYEYKEIYALVGIGVVMSLIYFTGWIVIAFAMVFIAIALWRKIGPMEVGIIISSLFVTTILFTSFYYLYYSISAVEVHKGIYGALFSRFTQGQNPAIEVDLWMKPVLAFKWLFINMECFDHPDKYLEGRPAIPLLFTLLFFWGLLKCHKITLGWLIGVFSILLTIYLFANRYAILALPAMAIIAANGVRVSKWYVKAFVTIGLIFTLATTYIQYYREFTLAKPANFEVDRMRGHTKFYSWVKNNFDPASTMIVLGDPVNLSPTPLMFHTFDNPFKFLIWSNYFNQGSKTEDIAMVEQLVWNAGYKRIVYAFSCQSVVDWTPFIVANPGLEPSFDYIYPTKGLLLVAFIKENKL